MTWALWLVVALAGLAYGIMCADTVRSWRRSIVKTLPLTALGLIALAANAPTALAAGLFLSAAGDLALSRPGGRAFLAGLAAFLLAHLAYLCVFWPLATGFTTPVLIGMALLAALGAIILRHVWTGAEGMRGAVLAYVVVILAMGSAALMLPASHRIASFGALLFIASDAVLADQTFVANRGAIQHRFVWIAYLGGQVAILAAFL